jgi:hypothetical protein
VLSPTTITSYTKIRFLTRITYLAKSANYHVGISEIILNQKNQRLKAPHTTMQESAKSNKSIKINGHKSTINNYLCTIRDKNPAHP